MPKLVPLEGASGWPWVSYGIPGEGLGAQETASSPFSTEATTWGDGNFHFGTRQTFDITGIKYENIPAVNEYLESYIKRLKEMEDIALSYPGVVKTYAIQAGRELRVIVGADKLSDQESEGLSHDIAKKIQDEMTYPGQVKITVIRETRAVAYAK